MSIPVRKASIKDLPQILKLGTELMASDKRFDQFLEEQWYSGTEGKKYLLSRIKGRSRICLVATMGEEIVGYATASLLTTKTWRPIRMAELENLIVTSSYRGQGAGNMLIAGFKQWSIAKGAKRVELEVQALNQDAISFYEKSGFAAQHIKMEANL